MKKLPGILFLVFSFILTKQSNSQTVYDDFTVLVIPDTQYYTDSLTYPGRQKIYYNQMQWTVDNLYNNNIVFVSHLGDITNNCRHDQWIISDKGLKKLDGVVPYGLAAGNHDGDQMNGSVITRFNSYFPLSRYQNQPWYGGSYPAGTNSNSYQLFKAAGMDFIIIHFQWGHSASVRQWASSILDKYPNRRAILSLHKNVGEPPSTGIDMDLWNDVAKTHANVFLVVNGHHYGENMVTNKNNFGGTVYHILTDYQHEAVGGNGKLRYYTFHPGQNKIEAFTYSTETKQYYTHFLLDYKMTDRTSPIISNIKITPGGLPPNDSITISATVTDSIGISIDLVKLLWETVPNSYIKNVTMIHTGGNSYTAKLPKPATGVKYYYKIFARNMIQNVTTTTFTDQTVSAEDRFNDDSHLTIYPNPTKGIFTVNLSDDLQKDDGSIMVFDELGRELFKQNITSLPDKSSFNIDLTPYSNGIYFLKYYGEMPSITKKIELLK